MAWFGNGLFSLSRRKRLAARRKLLVTAGAVFGLGVAAVAATAYSNLYVFGDSLSDTGNFSLAHPGVQPPASSPGYSNGQWITDLASHLGLSAIASGLPGGTNYAYGGALITGPSVVDGFTVPSVGDQIHAYLGSTPGGAADGDALYVVQAGPGNLANGGGAAAGAALAGLIGELAQSGARNFLVVTPPGSDPFNLAFFPNLPANLPLVGPPGGPSGGPPGGGSGGPEIDPQNPPCGLCIVQGPLGEPDPTGPELPPDTFPQQVCALFGTCEPPISPVQAALVPGGEIDVPEPATLVLLGLGATLLLGRRRRLA